MEYTPQTFKEAEAYDKGYYLGAWETIQELADFIPEVKDTGLWIEIVGRDDQK